VLTPRGELTHIWLAGRLYVGGHALPNTAAHSIAHCSTLLLHCRILSHCLTAAHYRTARQPHTAARTSTQYQAHCHILLRTLLRAHYCAHCHKLPHIATLLDSRSICTINSFKYTSIQMNSNEIATCISVCFNSYEFT
jgi:hypothetical protein